MMQENQCKAVPDLPVFCNACQVRGQSICADLDDTGLSKLTRSMQTLELDPGMSLAHQGDQVVNLYVITHGAMKHYKVLEDGRQQITGFSFPGDWLGLRAEAEFQTCIEALSPVRCCTFPHATLQRMERDAPRMLHRLIDNASTELAKAYDHMVLLGQKTVHERVATFLLTLAQRSGRSAPKHGPGAVIVPLPMTRRDIADYLALRSETLSRVLKTFKVDGLILEATRRSIIVSSLEDLEAECLIEADL